MSEARKPLQLIHSQRVGQVVGAAPHRYTTGKQVGRGDYQHINLVVLPLYNHIFVIYRCLVLLYTTMLLFFCAILHVSFRPRGSRNVQYLSRSDLMAP